MTLNAQTLQEETARYLWSLASLILAFIVIHLLPKAAIPADLNRLVHTFCFFVVGIGLCHHLGVAGVRLLDRRLSWAYHDAPPAIGKAMKRWLYSLGQVGWFLGTTVALFLAVTGIVKISYWFPLLHPLIPTLSLLWWGVAIVLVTYPWWGYVQLLRMWQQYRLFAEETALAEFKPRALHVPGAGPSGFLGKPVSILQHGEFEAGERRWLFDDLRKNLLVFGQPGAGKTSCVLNALLEGMLGSLSAPPASGLILDPKGDFQGKIERLATKFGRGDDLIVVNPSAGGPVKWNPLDVPDDEFEIAERFGAVMELLGVKDSQSSFWTDKAKQFIQHALVLLRATSTTPPSISDIATLATSKESILSLCEKVPETNSNASVSLRFFADEWFKLPDETLGGIQAHLTAMTNPFTFEPYRSFCSGRSSFRVSSALDEGKVIYLLMPVAEKEAMARVMGALLKLEFYREVLRRPDKPRPSFFFCDEFQVFFNAGKGRGDADFFERSRQSNHANIIACQNLQSLLKQVERREPVLNLLGNCTTKIFLRNTDKETNQYGADLFGQTLVGLSSGTSGVSALQRKHRATATVNFGDQFDHVVRPERFVELAIPSARTGIDYAETIIHDAAGENPNQRPRAARWRLNLV